MAAQPRGGMRDVEAVESSITAITPEGLFLRGVALDALVEQATFEELAFLLWHDRRPSAGELTDLRLQFTKAWMLPADVVPVVVRLAPEADPLWALQAALPLLALADPERDDTKPAAQGRQAARLLAQVPAVLACRHWGMPVARLDPTGSLAAQVLRALGSKPLPHAVANAALMLYADHELAASTFAARIAAAALSSLYDGLQAGIAVLKGPLHGGATVEVASLLRRCAAAPQIATAVDQVLAAPGRIPGFGHSVYTIGDPRAGHFRRLAEQIATGEARRWIEAAVMLEQRVLRERGMHANVDLYGATFMHAAGFKDRAMVALFAVARTAGWLAHMLEQGQNNRLIRPRARYTGTVGREWGD